MTWAMIAQMTIQYGLPFAEKMWEKWSANTTPTKADWDELKALAKVEPTAIMMGVLKKNDIDPQSEQGQALLALVK